MADNLRGTRSQATQFKKGNLGKPKGALSNKTLITQKVTKVITTDIAEYMNNGGIASLLADIELLPLKEQIAAKLTLLEYVKPKLARMEITVSKEQNVIEIFGKLPNEITNNDFEDIEEI